MNFIIISICYRFNKTKYNSFKYIKVIIVNVHIENIKNKLSMRYIL